MSEHVADHLSDAEFLEAVVQNDYLIDGHVLPTGKRLREIAALLRERASAAPPAKCPVTGMTFDEMRVALFDARTRLATLDNERTLATMRDAPPPGACPRCKSKDPKQVGMVAAEVRCGLMGQLSVGSSQKCPHPFHTPVERCGTCGRTAVCPFPEDAKDRNDPRRCHDTFHEGAK